MGDEHQRLDELSRRHVLLSEMCFRASIKREVQWCANRFSAALYTAHMWPLLGHRLLDEAEATFERLTRVVGAAELADLERCMADDVWRAQEHKRRVEVLRALGVLDDARARAMTESIASAHDAALKALEESQGPPDGDREE